MPKRIPLTRGLATIVDDEDYEELSQYRWYALQGKAAYYAARRNVRGARPAIVLMHRMLMEKELVAANDATAEIDHINNNSLDNRRSNLRVATKSQNSASTRRFDKDGNVKKYRGVWHYRGKWVASIKVEGQNRYLGRFGELADALRAYNAAATDAFGEFARLNDLTEFEPQTAKEAA